MFYQTEKFAQVCKQIGERRTATNELRRVHPDSIKNLQDAGFFKLLLKKEYGGLESDLKTFFHSQLEISKECMSTAWAGGIIAVHAYQMALMDKQAQDDVYLNNPHVLVASAYAPMGKIEPVDNGFMFSGHWAWNSGGDYCDWSFLGGIVPGEGYRTFLVPRSDYRIKDTWHSLGLKGTGSNDVIIDEPVFVPNYRTHKQLDGFTGNNPGKSYTNNSLYSIPWAQLFVRVVNTPAIGALDHAVKLFMSNLTSSSFDPSKGATDPDTLRRIAHAANTVDELICVLDRNLNVMSSGQELTLADRIRFRYQASVVIDRCCESMDLLMDSAGGRSVYTGSEIQQIFLDIHTARAHLANNPTQFGRNYANNLLGGENKDFFV
jgi:3-hydroxy-9,10-secoandrosta-1,3,5(10)-triene-9,17-dione monooxygenase